MTPSKPVQKNDGTTVGRYFPDDNRFVRRLNYRSHIFKKTNSSTFDENVIEHLEAYVDYYGNILEELIIINDYKDKPFNHLITYKTFLECTDNKKNLFFHHGKNKSKYKQYEIPIKNMVKEMKSGKSRT
tara:strand:+ start:116 stop:502 length:387 start_codon:yes stop_codon:yes gene_type:complete